MSIQWAADRRFRRGYQCPNEPVARPVERSLEAGHQVIIVTTASLVVGSEFTNSWVHNPLVAGWSPARPTAYFRR